VRALRWLNFQVTDLLTDFITPGLAAILPAPWSNRMLWHIARWRWLFPATTELIRHSESQCFGQEIDLPRRWAWTTLTEAAQAWRLMLGLRPRLRVEGHWPDQAGFIAAGMHYGAGIAALWHLRESGLEPRFVFRPVSASDLPGRPVKRVWYRLRTRLIMRLCPQGPISTGGAGQRILDVIDAGTATPVLLFDTPSLQSDDWAMAVGNSRLGLRSGGVRLFSTAGVDVSFFVVTIDPDSGWLELAIHPLESGNSLADDIGVLMEAAMRRDAGQWLLWHSARGLFKPGKQQRPPSGDR
jgi:hypothetical protein